MQAWENFLKKLESELGEETITRWLKPLNVIHFDACNLYLETSDAFQHLWFEEHIRPKLRTELLNNNNHQIKVHLTLTGHDGSGPTSSSSEASPSFEITSDPRNPWATFDTFVESSANKVPFQLLCELAGYNPATGKLETPKLALGAINPIYLYGSAGSGKTHLLMALADAMMGLGKNVLFICAETFTQHVISAIRNGNMQDFRRAYRHADLLIIDDVQIFARRAATQEEIFHTFNALHGSGAQLIFSGNVAPQLLSSIEERLISRFEWGISLPLEKLSQKEEVELLRRHAKSMKFPLDEATIHYMCEQFGSNTHALHKALEALILYTDVRKLNQHTLTSDKLKEALSGLIEKEKENAITPDRIIRAVADYYGIKSEDILSKSQTQEFSSARQVAMHLCRTRLNMPFIKIGTVFGRDHSTIISGTRHIGKRLEEKDQELTSALPEILRTIETP